VICVIGDGAEMFLDKVESSIKSNKPITREDALQILSTKSMSFTLNAYDQMIGLTKKDMTRIITSLNHIYLTQNDPIKKRIEEGFRFCYSLEKVETLRDNLKKAYEINFETAVKKALRYLPRGTEIHSTVYFTIDVFNPGMVYNGNIGVSIVKGLGRIDLDYLAHEFHHVGFHNCLSKRSGLILKAKDPRLPEEGVIQLVYHLVSEGLANHYCTPEMVKTGSHKSPQANTKIESYEQNLEEMIEDVWLLIKDCLDGTVSLSEYKERVSDIILDKESILPKVHFLGERMIAEIEENPENSFDEIIELCNKPENLIRLYLSATKEAELPSLQEKYVKKILKLFSSVN
jgi:hypothetical protein